MLLFNTNSKDRDAMIKAFDPFNHPGQYHGMLIGNDLDSVLSACFLKKQFGWDIAGFYDYKTLWCSTRPDDFMQKLRDGKIVAVDLDIYHRDVYSLGHHILHDSNPNHLPEHERSLNPNLIRNIDTAKFQNKYPLGTIHFLLWLFNVSSLSRESLLTVWLADSAFINGQVHKYARNVYEWVHQYLDLDIHKAMVQEITTYKFEKELSATILKRIAALELGQPSGQIRSKHLNLSGYQCQWNNPNKQRLQILDLFNTASSLTGWPAPTLPEAFHAQRGRRSKIGVDELEQHYGRLDVFLEKENVFSYVFPYKDSINYTKGIFE